MECAVIRHVCETPVPCQHGNYVERFDIRYKSDVVSCFTLICILIVVKQQQIQETCDCVVFIFSLVQIVCICTN